MRHIRIALVAALACALSAAAEPGPPRVLTIATTGVNQNELWTSVFGFLAAGYAVDIAAPQPGAFDGVVPNLALDAVDPAAYVALFIPGGRSPAVLEGDTRAVALCGAFMRDRRPVAAICHGPRLLAHAGLLDGYVTTALHDVVDERADLWRAGRFGSFIDQAVVVDRHLVTARYPGDGPAFTRATLDLLARSGGLASGDHPATILVWAPAKMGAEDRYLFHGALPALGATVVIARDASVADATVERAALLIVPPLAAGDPPPPAELVSAIAGRGEGVRVLAGNAELDLIRGMGAPSERCALLPVDRRVAAALLGAWLRALAPTPAAAPIEPARAAIALFPGCDPAAVAAGALVLRQQGLGILALGPEAGWLRALGGGPVAVEVGYDAAALASDAVILAPGGLWPTADDPRAGERRDWLLARWRAGATVIAVGHDAWRIGSDPACASFAIATSEQLRWSFPKGGGRWSDARALVSGERLLTVRAADDLAEVLALLRR